MLFLGKNSIILATAHAAFLEISFHRASARVQHHLCERYLWALSVFIGKLHKGFILFLTTCSQGKRIMMFVKPHLGAFGIFCSETDMWHRKAYPTREKAEAVFAKIQAGLYRFEPC